LKVTSAFEVNEDQTIKIELSGISLISQNGIQVELSGQSINQNIELVDLIQSTFHSTLSEVFQVSDAYLLQINRALNPWIFLSQSEMLMFDGTMALNTTLVEVRVNDYINLMIDGGI
jgi:hypothetical protein